MRKFILNILLGSILLLILLLSIYSFLNYANKQLLKNECAKAKVSVLFAGDSHVQMCFNDALIRNSKNIASSGECYQFTFEKLKSHVNGNNTITAVCLGFSYHNMSSYYDNFSLQTLPAFITVLPASDQIELIKKYDIEMAGKVNPILFTAAANLFQRSGNYSFSGGYLDIPAKKSISDSMIRPRILSQFYSEKNNLFPFSSYNISYLNKIILLCKTKNIKLFLINTPLHSIYRSGIPVQYQIEFSRFLKTNQVQTIDFSKFDLPSTSFQPDGDHLNNSGAKKISLYTDSLLQISK